MKKLLIGTGIIATVLALSGAISKVFLHNGIGGYLLIGAVAFSALTVVVMIPFLAKHTQNG